MPTFARVGIADNTKRCWSGSSGVVPSMKTKAATKSFNNSNSCSTRSSSKKVTAHPEKGQEEMRRSRGVRTEEHWKYREGKRGQSQG